VGKGGREEAGKEGEGKARGGEVKLSPNKNSGYRLQP